MSAGGGVQRIEITERESPVFGIPSSSPGPPIPTRETGVKWFRRGPMRPGFFVLAIGFASLLGAGVAAAGTLVQFPNLPGQTPAKLVGYLARPDTGLSLILGGGSADSARQPAVVVLHGCSGFSSHSAAIADRLGSCFRWATAPVPEKRS